MIFQILLFVSRTFSVTGSFPHPLLCFRCDSMSNSERSFEQSSFENMADDVFSPVVSLDSAPSPFGAPYGARPLSSCPIRGPGDVFRFDSPFCATPPPLPPKPTHHGHEDAVRNQGQLGLLPRRTSLSGGEHFRRGVNTCRHGRTHRVLVVSCGNEGDFMS